MARKKKTEQPVRSPEEEALCKKYPAQLIVVGSYGDFAEGSRKKAVTIKCQWFGCDETRRLATSDLFQCRYCPAHSVEAKKAMRKDARRKAGPTLAIADRRFDVTHNGNDLDLPYAELLNLVTHGETVLLSGTGRRIVQLEAGSYTVFDVPNDKEYGPYRDAAQAVKKAVSG